MDRIKDLNVKSEISRLLEESTPTSRHRKELSENSTPERKQELVKGIAYNLNVFAHKGNGQQSEVIAHRMRKTFVDIKQIKN